MFLLETDHVYAYACTTCLIHGASLCIVCYYFHHGGGVFRYHRSMTNLVVRPSYYRSKNLTDYNCSNLPNHPNYCCQIETEIGSRVVSLASNVYVNIQLSGRRGCASNANLSYRLGSQSCRNYFDSLDYNCLDCNCLSYRCSEYSGWNL